MMRVAGADGTPGGWGVVIATPGHPPDRVMFVRDIAGLFRLVPDIATLAIDIPIGLLDVWRRGGRLCDEAARRALPGRAASVFSPPIRPALAARDYADACAISRASAPGAGAISRQCFGIAPKIAEVDDFLGRNPELRPRVFEAFPELCFARLAGKPMIHRKSTPEGRAERRETLTRAFGSFEALLDQVPRTQIPLTDLLDASVVCWTALRLAGGTAESLIAPAPRDARGLPMTIWA